MANYDTYIEWKGWEEKDFLKYNKDSALFFEKEFGRYLVGTEIKTILEIGFGNGALLGWLFSCGKKVEGVEVNSNLVTRARERNIPAYANISDIQGKKYDLIIALDVLEHVKADEQEFFFRQIRQLLSERGIFIARFPNGDSPFALPTQNGDLTHVTAVGWHRLRHLATVSDMELLEYRGERLYSRNVVQKIMRSLINLVRSMVSEFLLRLYYPGIPRGTVTFKHINIVAVMKQKSSSLQA